MEKYDRQWQTEYDHFWHHYEEISSRHQAMERYYWDRSDSDDFTEEEADAAWDVIDNLLMYRRSLRDLGRDQGFMESSGTKAQRTDPMPAFAVRVADLTGAVGRFQFAFNGVSGEVVNTFATLANSFRFTPRT